MGKVITQRQLRNESGRIMRGLDRGLTYLVTRNGVPVGELRPLSPRRFVPVEELSAAFAGSPPIDAKRFRKDVDRWTDQDSKPRG